MSTGSEALPHPLPAETRSPHVIVDCAHYRDGRRQHEGPMRPEDAAAICGRDPGSCGSAWSIPRRRSSTRSSSIFGLHELAVEDAQSFHLRPKVEQYDEGIAFVVLRTARYVAEREEVEFGEISIFLGESFLITVRQGAASDLHAGAAAAGGPAAAAARGPDGRLWAIVDQVVDDYAPVVEELERDIEEVEQLVFTGAVAPVQRIYHLRREVTRLLPRRAPAARAAAARARTLLDVSAAMAQYFRDVNDHLALVNEEVIAQRDLLTTVLQANMAVIGVEQTDIVRRISGWARS